MKKEEGFTKRLVMKLLSCLDAHSWHRVGMDGFFTSVELFRELESKGFLAVGTTRNNRKHFPKELLEEVKGLERCGDSTKILFVLRTWIRSLSIFFQPFVILWKKRQYKGEQEVR